MKVIGLPVELSAPAHQDLLSALGAVFDVRFEVRPYSGDAAVDAWLLIGADARWVERLAQAERPSFVVVANGQRISCEKSKLIEFETNPELMSVFSGRRVDAGDETHLQVLRETGITRIVARYNGEALWGVQENGPIHHHVVSMPLPELKDGEALFFHFHGKHFIHLLPLILFLRATTETNKWEGPSLRACYIFDDPNLHWKTYGYVDFAEIANQAKAWNYHMAFATVPLDGWFVHKPTCALFREHAARISLLIHGNDHVSNELARPYSPEERHRLFCEALHRIEQFEQRSGLQVSRIMAPPHGACSESSLQEMAQVGFEGASISRGSLRRHNMGAPWVRTVGFRPSDIIGGLTVLPRFVLSGTCQNSVLIAALLNQPILPMGHHQDVADGLTLLSDIAQFINSLGEVRWVNMQQISRSHFAQKREGSLLRVRMLSKRIEVQIPKESRRIEVERPWLAGGQSEPLVWRAQGLAWTALREEEDFAAHGGQVIEIASGLPANVSLNGQRRIPRPWPLVRRQLAEARDRVMPLFRQVSAPFRSKGNKVSAKL